MNKAFDQALVLKGPSTSMTLLDPNDRKNSGAL
jgi:hypothetical protein